MKRLLAVLAVIVFHAGLCLKGAEAQWGTIKGQIVVTGSVSKLPPLVKSGDPAAKDSSVCAAADVPDESIVVDAKSNGLANVFIWLAMKPTTIHPDLIKSKDSEVILRQIGCKYVPHVMTLRTDQKLRILNDDASAHNQHLYAAKNSQFSAVVALNSREGELVSYLTMPERLPIKIGCDIHPWMNGWVIVQDHPYVAVTNSNGEFEMKNLPIGQHEFCVWQEKAGYLDKAWRITVKDGGNQLTELRYQVSLFN